jgi:hypothetical protein
VPFRGVFAAARTGLLRFAEVEKDGEDAIKRAAEGVEGLMLSINNDLGRLVMSADTALQEDRAALDVVGHTITALSVAVMALTAICRKSIEHESWSLDLLGWCNDVLDQVRSVVQDAGFENFDVEASYLEATRSHLPAPAACA